MTNKNLYNYNTPKSGNEETGFFNIKGRINRKVFFLRWLFTISLYIISSFLYFNGYFGEYDSREYIFFETIHIYILPFFISIFNLIQGAKRMHDIDKSGLYFLVPFYNIYLAFSEGTKGNNNYGIDPKPIENITYFDELISTETKEGDPNNKLSRDNTTINKKSLQGSSKNSITIWIVSILFLITICLITINARQSDIHSRDVSTFDSQNELSSDTPLDSNDQSKKPTAAEIRANITWTGENDGYFIDSRDNHQYAVKRFGDQVWMIDNLKYASNESVSLRGDPSNDSNGRLYNWDDAKECAPEGWRLPEWTDFNTLLTRLSQNELFDPMHFNLYSAGNAFLDPQRLETEFPQWNDWICFWTSTRFGNEVAWALIHYDTGLELNWSDSYRKGRTEFGAYYGVRCILDD
jgi:uncharacterized membrane protein YhaH (DUF805 family)